MVYKNIVELIGNTPLVKLDKIKKAHNLNFDLYGKLEKQNPAGSIKDRPVLEIFKDYQKAGVLKKGSTIIEPTSGNTGIALSALANYFDYKVIIVMPSSMSIERRNLIKAYNAELVLVDGGMADAVNKAEELKKSIPGSIIFGQFTNLSNPKSHYLHTAIEIHEDLKKADVIIAGIGTGGTISGIGRYYKENNLPIEIIGVEPTNSPLISKGYSGKHKIQGIGANFIPETLNLNYVDKIITVEDEVAIETAKDIVRKEGLLVGISSGAALAAAISLSKDKKYENKNIVVILPDTGERYQWN
ncbi:MAG: cysteine synthase A [Erysipelotrichaceae bacterium]|jgi:cysteine synthase A|nr:cysteine synthase A [Erysipelotrichaceae bacterium]